MLEMASTTVKCCSNTRAIIFKFSRLNGMTYSRIRQRKQLYFSAIQLVFERKFSSSKLTDSCIFSQRNEVTFKLSGHPCQVFKRFYTRVKVGEGIADEEALLSLNFLFIRTCKNWWFEAPNGVEFDTGFLDSAPGATYSERIPVVLGLPSAVGSHKELADLLNTFAKLGYRVIIPNLPGTTLCKARSRMDDAIFQFSVEEKAQFIKDFLEELEIPKVDMLVTNGCSVYTGLNLCLHNPDQFKSLSLINPTGIRPTKSMMPNYFTVSVVHVWEEQMHVRLLLMPYVWIGKLFTPNRHLGNKELVTFSRSAFRISYKNVQMGAREYRARGLPTFVVYSDTCPDLDIQATEDLLTLAGIPGSAIVALNENDEIVKEGAANGTSTGLLFKGHVGDIKKSKAPTIRKHLIKFFKTVRPDV